MIDRKQESPIVVSSGEHPSRVIMVERDGKYSTHVEVLPVDGPPSLIWGHYDMTLGEAWADFIRRSINSLYMRRLA